MSASQIKAGGAYVDVTAKDSTKPTFDRVESNFRALSGAIAKESRQSSAAVAHLAAKAAADTTKMLVARQREIKKIDLPAAESAIKPGAVSSEAIALVRTLKAEQVTLAKQVEAAQAKQLQLAKASAAVRAQQNGLDKHMFALARQFSDELAKQNTLKLSSTKQADQLLHSYSRQRSFLTEQTTALISQLRTLKAQGESLHVQAAWETAIRDQLAQRQTVSATITSATIQRNQLAAQELAAEQAVTAEKTRQAALTAQANAGRGNVTAALTAGRTTNQINSLSSSKDADQLLRTYTQQRNLIVDQARALMSQLQTVKAQGASLAQQAPIFAAIRDQIAQRQVLDANINAATIQRNQLAAKELAQQQAITAEKNRQAHLSDPQRNLAAWNAGNASQIVNGLSPQAMKEFAGSVHRVKFRADGAYESVSKLNRGFSALGKSSGRSQMMIQQGIFAIDDAASSYGTGGLAGAVRGASNNLTMMASGLGPKGFALAVLATSVIQLVLAFQKKKEVVKDVAKEQDKLNVKLREYEQLAKHRVELSKEHDSERLSEMASPVRDQVKANDQVIAKLKLDLAAAKKDEAESLKEHQHMEKQVVFDGSDANAKKKWNADKAIREGIEKQVNDRLTEQKVLRTQLKEITDKQARVEAADRGRDLQIHKWKREIQERQKAGKLQRELYEDEIAYRDKLNNLVREGRTELRKEADAHGSRRAEILKEYHDRKTQIMLMGGDKQSQQYLAISTQRKFRELDKSDPVNSLGKQLENELDGKRGERRQLIDQAKDRMFDLRQQLSTQPERAGEIRKLMGGVRASLGQQLSNLSTVQNRTANTAVDARSAEGWSMVLDAIHKPPKSEEQQMFEDMAAQRKLSEKQLALWQKFMRENNGAPILVAKSTK